jgi:hypothetical protein
MQPRPFWEDDSRSAGRKILGLLWNQKFYYHVQFIPSQWNSLHTIITLNFKYFSPVFETLSRRHYEQTISKDIGRHHTLHASIEIPYFI